MIFEGLHTIEIIIYILIRVKQDPYCNIKIWVEKLVKDRPVGPANKISKLNPLQGPSKKCMLKISTQPEHKSRIKSGLRDNENKRENKN